MCIFSTSKTKKFPAFTFYIINKFGIFFFNTKITVFLRAPFKSI
jgi:hypothetical protein